MAKHKGPKRPPAQKRPPLTHFLCLPLVTPESKPQLEAALKTFKDDVSPKDPTIQNAAEDASNDESQETVLSTVHSKAIRPLGSLHCTLGVMSLERQKLSDAVDLLQNIDIPALLKDAASKSTLSGESTVNSNTSAVPPSLEGPSVTPSVDEPSGPLVVDLKGLVPMHAPTQTSILYNAPSDGSGRLLPFCVALQKHFKDQGFLVEDNRPLKLHATVVNTIYAKDRKRRPKSGTASKRNEGDQTNAESEQPPGHGPDANPQLKIDATAILEKYKDFVWAENVVLDRVAICEMGAKKVMDDDGNVTGEEYTEIGSIRLPT